MIMFKQDTGVFVDAMDYVPSYDYPLPSCLGEQSLGHWVDKLPLRLFPIN